MTIVAWSAVFVLSSLLYQHFLSFFLFSLPINFKKQTYLILYYNINRKQLMYNYITRNCVNVLGWHIAVQWYNSWKTSFILRESQRADERLGFNLSKENNSNVIILYMIANVKECRALWEIVAAYKKMDILHNDEWITRLLTSIPTFEEKVIHL